MREFFVFFFPESNDYSFFLFVSMNLIYMGILKSFLLWKTSHWWITAARTDWAPRWGGYGTCSFTRLWWGAVKNGLFSEKIKVVISGVPNSFRQDKNLALMYLYNKLRLFEEINRTVSEKAVTKLPSNQGCVWRKIFKSVLPSIV